MKKLIISILLLSITLQQNIFTAGIATDQREELARFGLVNDAALTSWQEERERMEGVDDAYLTERQEEFERMNGVDDAATTEAAERVARDS
jgi:hypothetical protein